MGGGWWVVGGGWWVVNGGWWVAVRLVVACPLKEMNTWQQPTPLTSRAGGRRHGGPKLFVGSAWLTATGAALRCTHARPLSILNGRCAEENGRFDIGGSQTQPFVESSKGLRSSNRSFLI